MIQDNAVIRPARIKSLPDLGPVGIMVSSEDDFQRIVKMMDVGDQKSRKLMLSRFYAGTGDYKGVCVVGPVVGAPYAVLLLEFLIAQGVKKIIYFGWCGSIHPEIEIGDIVLPVSSLIEEGTSVHYGEDFGQMVKASSELVDKLRTYLTVGGISFHEGPIWTTDAVYRETPEKVQFYQQQYILAVEMELSALFTVSRFRGIEAGGILVVSDGLGTLTWTPGFKNERFKASRRSISEMMADLCQVI